LTGCTLLFGGSQGGPSGLAAVYSEIQGGMLLTGTANGPNGGPAWAINPSFTDVSLISSLNPIFSVLGRIHSAATRSLPVVSPVLLGTTSIGTQLVNTTVLTKSSTVSILQGDLIVASAGKLLVATSTVLLNVSGSFYAGGFTSLTAGALISTQKALVINTGASLEVVFLTRPTTATVTTIVFAFNSTVSNGLFTFSARNAFDQCTSFSVPQPSLSSSSLSITVSVVSSTCSSSGLSTGAIIGIAVGATVAGILAIVAIALLVKFATFQHDKNANFELRKQDLEQVR
jgi:hypothetical protein